MEIIKSSRFQKGSGRFTCSCCGKLTRATGRNDNEHVEMCVKCYDESIDENSAADGRKTEQDAALDPRVL